ncbi:hypothetical protein LCGC14_0365160 [marine sediment metagenome]|uniref:Nuclease associated modular domain-containing protein n=1 Tax=marine sediment metagenome TaxID=412755 RepID=A0A0F9TCT1_9ZZZZ
MFPEQYKNRLLMNTTVHSDGCWLYNGTKSNGYGRMTIGSRGDKCWWYGKHHKKESIEKNRQTQKGRKFTKEHRENMSKAAQKRGKGKDSPNYGVRRSKKARKRMSEAQLLRYKRERYEVLK